MNLQSSEYGWSCIHRHEPLGMISFYVKRNPYGVTKEELLQELTNFKKANEDFTPNCYRGKVWELIRLDFEDWVKES